MQAEFVLSVQGQLKECVSDLSASAFCKAIFAGGPDWSLIGGSEEVLTQVARLERRDGTSRCVWNLPIEVLFKAPRPFGWPQLIITVMGVGAFGKPSTVGCGAVHLPTEAGHHEVKIPLFTRAPSPAQRIAGWFGGAMPEAIPYAYLGDGDSRESLKTESHGYVSVSFDVVISGLKKLDLHVQSV